MASVLEDLRATETRIRRSIKRRTYLLHQLAEGMDLPWVKVMALEVNHKELVAMKKLGTRKGIHFFFHDGFYAGTRKVVVPLGESNRSVFHVETVTEKDTEWEALIELFLKK